ncbi:MAG: HDOD domain-containing protein [Myxococcota bacterium]|nr:HDOD domain-containing protein [Myxococcota bacterium]
MNKFHRTDFSDATVYINAKQVDTLLSDEDELTRKVGATVMRELGSETYQPPLLPEVALSLSEMANQRDVSIREVENAVSRDPAVAARVVSVANSAFYSRGTPIRSLRSAITRLGLAEIRDVAFQVVAQTRIFRVRGYGDHMRRLFSAAQAAGLIARKTCQMLRFESEMAYLCGLLHDMGEAIILSVIAEAQREKRAALPELTTLRPVLDLLHATAGARVCSKWGLPELITDAVRHHHSPQKSETSSQMATVVAIGDILLAHAGIGCEKKPVVPLEEPMFYRVNLTPPDVEALIEYAEAIGEDEALIQQLE